MNSSIVVVGIGGCGGTILRYLLSSFFKNTPTSTIIINLIGCFVIGAISSLLDYRFPINNSVRLLLITGFVGSFTTFSTFSLDGFNFLNEGYFLHAFFYIMIQVALGISMVSLGNVLVKKVIWSM